MSNSAGIGDWIVCFDVDCLISGAYNWQTLITGMLALGAAIMAGLPVWRQLKDSNLQTKISHREVLTDLLASTMQRSTKIDDSMRKLLSDANDWTSDPIGEPAAIESEAAFHLEGRMTGALDWYLLGLADTENSSIETQKAKLSEALKSLVHTLGRAHWADHNDREEEGSHSYSAVEWEEIVAECAAAKIGASAKVGDVNRAYNALMAARLDWVRSLRSQIARLDKQIAASSL